MGPEKPIGKQAFEDAYARRSDKTWYVPPGSLAAKVRDWGSNALIVASSPKYGEQIAALFERINYRYAWFQPGDGEQTAENFAGVYENTRITVMHIGITPRARGASYMDMALESLRSGPVQKVIVIGELSALQEEVQPGDLVIPLAAIRADDSHRSYAAPEIPAAADPALSQCLLAAARQFGHRVHKGLCWSCGAAAGIYDPFLLKQGYQYQQMGVLGNALEAGTAYLLAKELGIKLSSLWLAADSLFHPLQHAVVSPQIRWTQGWQDLVRVSLKALVLSTSQEDSG